MKIQTFYKFRDSSKFKGVENSVRSFSVWFCSCCGHYNHPSIPLVYFGGALPNRLDRGIKRVFPYSLLTFLSVCFQCRITPTPPPCSRSVTVRYVCASTTHLCLRPTPVHQDTSIRCYSFCFHLQRGVQQTERKFLLYSVFRTT